MMRAPDESMLRREAAHHGLHWWSVKVSCGPKCGHWTAILARDVTAANDRAWSIMMDVTAANGWTAPADYVVALL
jgi:hypothetical protein